MRFGDFRRKFGQVPDGGSVGSSYVPKTVIALPSTPDGQPMFTVQERIDPENVDRFPFDLIVYSSADQRDGTTHSFAAESPDEQVRFNSISIQSQFNFQKIRI